MPPFDLNGKIAVVLGGTSGLGRTLSLALAAAGADVIASARDVAAVTELAEEIRSMGRSTLARPVNVTDRTSIQTLHDEVLSRFPRVDILLNCAGITRRVPTLDCTEELWSSIMDTNLTGTLRACQVFGETMLKQRYGRIVNIASLSSFVAFQEVAAYGASKAAVASLTRSLAVEWAPFGVTVNAIAPGIFPTALNSAILDSSRGQELLIRTPMQRFGHPEELISTLLYLVAEASGFVTGQVVAVDGGFLASGVNQ